MLMMRFLSFGFIWGKYSDIEAKNDGLILKSRFASKTPIDVNSAKCVYSIKGSKNSEVKMELKMINDPGR